MKEREAAQLLMWHLTGLQQHIDPATEADIKATTQLHKQQDMLPKVAQSFGVDIAR